MLDTDGVRAPCIATLTCLLALAISACGDAAKSGTAPAASATACVRFGDRCEVSPGKLGACVEKTGCTGPGCFVCQSQH